MHFEASFTHRRVFLAAVVALALAPIAVAHAGDNSEGRALYLRYCASCHGEKADGRGPVARSLKDQPADLTRLGEKYGMPLPHGQIARFADGRADVAAHGTREMPVWGERFSDIYSSKGSKQGEMPNRIDKIIDYLNSIQTGSPNPEPPRKKTSMRAPEQPRDKM